MIITVLNEHCKIYCVCLYYIFLFVYIFRSHLHNVNKRNLNCFVDMEYVITCHETVYMANLIAIYYIGYLFLRCTFRILTKSLEISGGGGGEREWNENILFMNTNRLRRSYFQKDQLVCAWSSERVRVCVCVACVCGPGLVLLLMSIVLKGLCSSGS